MPKYSTAKTFCAITVAGTLKLTRRNLTSLISLLLNNIPKKLTAKDEGLTKEAHRAWYDFSSNVQDQAHIEMPDNIALEFSFHWEVDCQSDVETLANVMSYMDGGAIPKSVRLELYTALSKPFMVNWALDVLAKRKAELATEMETYKTRELDTLTSRLKDLGYTVVPMATKTKKTAAVK